MNKNYVQNKQDFGRGNSARDIPNKLKIKFNKAMPKTGVDLLGIAKKLSAKKFVKQ